MKSHTNRAFRRRYALLPPEVRNQAVQAYRLWLRDPWHNSLRFKKVHQTDPIYSVRVGSDWRAVGVRRGDDITWFWIGPHAEYDGLLRQL